MINVETLRATSLRNNTNGLQISQDSVAHYLLIINMLYFPKAIITGRKMQKNCNFRPLIFGDLIEIA